MRNGLGVPTEATGIQLCRLTGDELRMTEKVMFARGGEGVEITLRRAAVSGLVEVNPPGELPDYWADMLDGEGDVIGHVALDRRSFNKLKNHWMRCRYVKAA